MRNRIPLFSNLKSLLVLAAAVGLVGCGDSATDAGDPETTTYRGTVAEYPAGSSTLYSADEEARVTAEEVEKDGRTESTDAETTTDANGSYTLTVENAGKVMLIKAVQGSSETSVLAYNRFEGEGSIAVAPMTIETHAESEVYTEAKKEDDDGEGEVTVADVALFVTSEVASELTARGSTSFAEVAAAIAAHAEAEDHFVVEADDEGAAAISVKQDAALEAYATLQSQLNAATSAQAEAQAFLTFQESMMEAYAGTNVSAEVEAKARQAAQAALVRFSSSVNADVRFALEKQAAIQAASAAATAVEATFQASGASASRLATLAQARADLLTELRAATKVSALANARADYNSAVESELAAEMNVEASAIASARSAVSTAKTSLEAAVAIAGSAETVVDAYLAFYTAAEAAIASSFSGSADADLGAEVLTLISVR